MIKSYIESCMARGHISCLKEKHKQRYVDTWPFSTCSLMQFVSKCHLHLRKDILSYLSTALQPLWHWPFFSFLNSTQSVGHLGRGISPSQDRYLHTEKTHKDIHVSSGIRTHAPSVWDVGNGSCLRPLTVIGIFSCEFWKYVYPFIILFRPLLRNDF
jgi:hypothetical protein